MNLKEEVYTGDLLFYKGNSLVSKIIQKTTGSNFSHVGLVYDQEHIFETDLSWGKAQLRKLDHYEGKEIYVVRLRQLNNYSKIKGLCQKYDKTPYSILDISTNLLFSMLKDSLREKLVRLVGTKKFAICSELSARILYEATKYSPFKHYEGFTPQDLFMITCLDQGNWEVVLDHLKP